MAHGQERASRRQAQDQLTAQALEHAQLAEQLAALQERLKAEEAYRASLEEKHQHAWEALEHFRQAAKEQRELRQREQQVQYLQSELATVGEALAAKQLEVKHAYQEEIDVLAELRMTRSEVRQHEERLRELKSLPEDLAAQTQALGELRAKRKVDHGRVEEMQARARELEQRNLERERMLAATKAVSQAQEHMVASLLMRLGASGEQGVPAAIPEPAETGPAPASEHAVSPEPRKGRGKSRASAEGT